MLRVSSRRKVSQVAALTAAGVLAGLYHRADAASSNWIATSPGNWSTPTNWASGVVPGDLTGGYLNTDTATFNTATGVVVTIDQTNQSIGSIAFSGAPGAFSIGAVSQTNPLFLGTNGSITDASTGSGAQTFNAPLSLGGAYSIIENSNSSSMTFAGAITDSSALTLSGTGANASASAAINITGSMANFNGVLNVNTAYYDKVAMNTAGTVPTNATINIGTSNTSNSTFYTNQAFGSGVAFNISGPGNLEGYGALRIDGGSVAGPVYLATTSSTIGVYSGTSTISGAISGSNLTKVGGGTLTLSGTNTYTGPTTFSSGTITVTGNESAATGGWIIDPTNSNTVTANFNATSQIAVSAGNGIQLGYNGTGSDNSIDTQSLNVYGIVNNAGYLFAGRTSVLTVESGGIWNQSGSSATISGEGGYPGAITINSGGTFNYTGTSPFQIDGSPANSGSATLTVDGTLTTGQGFVDASSPAPTSGAGTLAFAGGTLTLTNSIPQLLTNTTGAISMSLGAGGGIINTAGFTTTINQPITGSGELVVIGGGTVTLTATNTFTGPTAITSSTLDLSSTLALQKSTLVSSGIVFDQSVGSHAFSIGGLSGNYALNLMDNASNPVALTIGTNNTAATFSGTLSGPGSLTKAGTAQQILSGTNTYTGTTSVTAGILEFQNEVSLYDNAQASWTSSDITVSSGATLAVAVGGTGQFVSSDLDTLLANLDTSGSVGLMTGSSLGLDVTGSFTYADPIPGGIGITKLGAGTLTLSGTSSFTGKISVNAGTLNETGSLTGSPGLTFAGTSAFTWTAPAAGANQAMGALAATVGEGTLTSVYTGGSANLSFSSLTTRTTGAALNFVVSNGSNGTTNQIDLVGKAAGFIDQGTFFGGSNYAYVDPSGFVRGINYAGDSGASTSGATVTLASTSYQQFTGAVSGQTTATFTTLNDSGANAFNITSGSTVTTNGILKSGNNSASITGPGAFIDAASGAELVIRTDQSSDVLNVQVPIIANGTNALTKSGAGTLILDSPTTDSFKGATTVDSGTLELLNNNTSSGTYTYNALNTSSGVTVQRGATLFISRNYSGSGDTTNPNLPTTTLNDGSTLKYGSTNGTLTFAFSNNFTINGNVAITQNGGSYTNNTTSSGAFSGTGNINLTSTAGSVHSFNFSGASPSYAGNWNVSSGNSTTTAVISAAPAALGTGVVTLNALSSLSASVNTGLNSLSGVTLTSSTATLNGPIGWSNPVATVGMSAGTFNVGSAASIGAISLGSLNQSGGTINLYPTSTASDVINLAGNYNYTGGSINLTFNGTPSAPVYTLVNYAGTLTNDPTVNTGLAGGSRITYTVNYGTGFDSSITLVESGGPASLIWTGAISNAWDIDTTQNWYNTGTSAADYFFNYDNVLFNDTATNFNPTIASGTTVLPASMAFNNSAHTYTVSGGGAIGGATSLVKSGSGLLIISTTNSYTGGTFLNGGTVAIGAASALGSAPASAAVNITFNGGTLQTTGNATFTATQNVLVNSSGGTIDLDSNAVTVAGVISGTGPLVINNTGNASGGVFTTSAINTDTGILTINNDATVNLANTSTPAGSTQAFSQIVINAGSTLNTVGTHEFGYAASTRPLLNISGGTVDNSGADDNYLGQLIMTGGTVTGLNDYRLQTTTGYSTASVVTLASPNASVISIPSLELVSSTTFNISSGAVANGIDLVVSSNVSGGGLFLQKTGPGVMSLSGSDSYTGGTIVSAGKLILASGTAYPANTSLNVASGATVTIANHSTFSTYVPQASALINSGTIDVVNNAFLVHNGSIGTITAEVAKAFNNGWTATNLSGGVITSSLAAADTTRLTAVGVATGLTSFEGLTVASTDVLVKYTYYGDANLSGTVDGSDYSLIDNAYEMEGWVNGVETNAPISGWYNGDFNYDGVVDGSDYTLIDNAFNSQGANISAQIASPTAEIAPSGGVSAVPEPTSLGLLGIGAIGLLGRRRRRH
jgi:autotransporter-associated beta strand protein